MIKELKWIKVNIFFLSRWILHEMFFFKVERDFEREYEKLQK